MSISHQEFSAFMFNLQRAIPAYAPEMGPDIIAVWYQQLKDCSADQLRKAFVVLCSTEKAFPTIARIRELVRADSASGKFDELISLISKHGAYKPPTNVPEVMARAINRMGGWRRICDWTDEELPYRRKEFEAAYGELLEQQSTDRLPLGSPTKLVGIHETTTAQPTGKIAIGSGQ